MKKKLLFNPHGNDSITERKMIGGNPTNIMNLNSVKYKSFLKLYRQMLANHWIPETVDLSSDVLDYKKLTAEERRAYFGILSFLIFLDSLQTNNVPNLSAYITASEINTCLSLQTSQEAVHSQSYQYVVETVLPPKERDAVYEYWREDEILFERNRYIAQKFQDFINDPTEENFKIACVANYILEGLYFYNGFNFFYNLASRNHMTGTANMIAYIQKDELTHVVIFQNILREILTEDDHEMVYDLFKEAVEQEIKWTNHIIGNNILGINEDSTEQYTKWLANDRLKNIKLNKLYRGEKYSNSPYKHLNKMADEETPGENVKGNYFESDVIAYTQASGVDGWDDF